MFQPKLEKGCCSLWCFPGVFHHRATLVLVWNHSSGYWFTFFIHTCWTLHVRIQSDIWFFSCSQFTQKSRECHLGYFTSSSCPVPSFDLQGLISKMLTLVVPSSPVVCTANNLLSCWLWSSVIPKRQISPVMHRNIVILEDLAPCDPNVQVKILRNFLLFT